MGGNLAASAQSSGQSPSPMGPKDKAPLNFRPEIVSAMPIGSIAGGTQVFVQEVESHGGLAATPTAAPTVASTTGVGQSGPIALAFAETAQDINIPSANITVGSATINVLSSFTLNYGGQTILTGSNGTTSSQ